MAVFQMPKLDEMLVPDMGLLDSFLRGTLVYFAVLTLLRVFPRRQVGSVGLTDLLLIVLISECVSQALSDKSSSVTNGVVAVSALLFWNFVLDWAAHRWPWFQRLLEPAPLPLIRDGVPLRGNLKKERMSEDELLSHLREKGIDDFARVKSAHMEPEGHISVVPKDPVAAIAPGATAPPDASRPASANGSVPVHRRDANGPSDCQSDSRPPAADQPPDFNAALGRFLEAAEALRAAIAWHEDRAADHTAKARAARAALSRHGVRGRALLQPKPPAEDPPARPPSRTHPTTLTAEEEDV
jgi:uncharacterized membrane protein YcaP (DUF421 family)